MESLGREIMARRITSDTESTSRADHAPTSVPLPGAAADGPISHAIFRVARLHRMIAGQLLRDVGLYPGQELLMMQLWNAGPQRQVDLIRVLDSDAATMTRMIRRLEQAGFVRRRRCTTDARAVIVEPTPASQALRAKVEQIWGELETLTAADLDPAGQADALATLEQIEQTLAAAAQKRGWASGGTSPRSSGRISSN